VTGEKKENPGKLSSFYYTTHEEIIEIKYGLCNEL
jgi:hypothetical protein